MFIYIFNFYGYTSLFRVIEITLMIEHVTLNLSFIEQFIIKMKITEVLNILNNFNDETITRV